MSKVFDPEFIFKSKCLRRNRRVETRKKKAERFEYVKYVNGYWLNDNNFRVKYKLVDIPDYWKTVSKYKTKAFPIFDENNKIVVNLYGEPLTKSAFVCIDEAHTFVPTHTEKVVDDFIFEPRKTPLVRHVYWRAKTSCKKVANKRVRRHKDCLDHNQYKKLYDLFYDKW